MPRGPKPLKGKLKENQFYCVSCRKRVAVPVDDIKFKLLRSPRRRSGKAPALRSQCGKCATNLTKFVKSVKAAALKKKYA